MKKRSRKAKGVIVAAFCVLAVVAGVLVYKKYETATVPRVEAPVQQPQHPPAGARVVSLFFGAPDGEGLVREGREVETEEGMEDYISSVLEDLINGPLGTNAPTLPENTRVLGVRLNGPVAEIDFSKELRDGLPSGSSAEVAAVYSVVDTVTANFPQIKVVQFLIEGEKAESLKGHLDLRNPIAPDYSLERKS
ncbi:GerMN domain-containing protein [Geomonas sp. RF6]|uniref:GerMN domain-containing protein n=1 Tax=Geomonas sp. RF6 TaxID=2897342 RepID=UPI001E457617|nr:GerMN domain-containing protein [Geomonas sp. RF6]UFS72592.1 GerMN domain-containing protein [Geomonas sp. RF6]